jgi:5,6-dimethylbenzimidazole synthase
VDSLDHTNKPALTNSLAFSAQEQLGLYKTIFNRRDVRGQFLDTEIPNEVLSRVLYAAHHAPSVGFMQPWNFIVIQSDEVKDKIHQDFSRAHQESDLIFDSLKRYTYKNLKLEGILESPINICITCDRARTGKTVIGRTHMPEMDLYSSVCAVQNFWLAARAEGLGVGWVSILHPDALRETLSLPDSVEPIAYLCVGYVSHFHSKPELESANWLKRSSIEELVNFEQWGQQASNQDQLQLIKQLKSDKAFPEKFVGNKKVDIDNS